MEMTPLQAKEDGMRRLAQTWSADEQVELREPLRGDDYHKRLFDVCLVNPFLRLTDDELETLRADAARAPLWRLVQAREAAARSTAPKYVVFCMPKSGSSFVQTSLRHALQLPFVSLTSFGTPASSSHFGMNSREQELDELAILKSVARFPSGFIAQQHTRYSMYLALQMRFFRITPILTVRNILDCIVSFDDMMLAWRRQRGEDAWVFDTPFSLPLDYVQRSEAERYEILAHSFGVWLIAFFLSWKRGVGQKIVDPIVIRYEDDLLDRDRLIDRLSTRLDMTEDQAERLARHIQNPDRRRSRFNVGAAGRGKQMIPDEVKQWLSDYAARFRGEIGQEDIRQLIG